MNEHINLGGIKQTLEGFYKVSVVDAKTDKVIWEMPKFEKNLILNQGMDMLVSYVYADVMLYAVAGNGGRANNIDSATATVTQVGTAITLTPDGTFTSFLAAVGGYTNALQVGDTIVFDAGAGGITYVQIAGGIGATTATANVSANIPSTQFQVFKTSQVGLQAELKRAGTHYLHPDTSWVTGAGYCQTNWVSPTLYLRRTYDFSVEIGLVNYTEIGVSYNINSTNGGGGNANTVFSRILLSGTVAVGIGQKLRVTYELQVTLAPDTNVSRPGVSITGWPVLPSINTDCTEKIQNVLGSFNVTNGYYNTALISQVGYTGISGATFSAALEPYSSGNPCTFWVSIVSTALQAFNTAANRWSATPAEYGLGQSSYGGGASSTVKSAYTPGTYTVTKTGTIGIYDANRTDIYSMGFGYFSPDVGAGATWPLDTTHQAFANVFAQPQTKKNTQTLTLSYVWTWARTYVA